MEEWEKAFPLCAGRPLTGSVSCETTEQAFHNLRRAVLLSPERRDLWEFLSCVYKKGGFDQNSLVLERTARASRPDTGDLDKWLTEFLSYFDEESSERPRFGAVLMSALLEAGQTAVLEELIQHENPNLRRSLAQGALLSEDPYMEDLLQEMSHDPDTEVRRAVAVSAGQRGGFSDLILLEEMSHDGDSEIRAEVAVSIGKMLAFPHQAVALLREMSLDISSLVKRRTARSAGLIGGPLALDLLRDMFHQHEENSNMRAVTVWSAVNTKEITGLSDFLWEARHDKSMKVREAVAFNAIEIPEAEALLADMSQDPDPHIREVVALMTGTLTNPAALLILKRMCGDQDLVVRQQAARNIPKIENILLKKGLVLEEVAPCIEDGIDPTASPI